MADDAMYMTAREAAALLEISVQTLYAYVSRKNLRSRAVPGTRARLYWRPDIERLMGSGALQPWPALAHGPDESPDSEITLLTKHGLYYRGRDAIELAESAPFETVAALLWGVDEAVTFTATPPAVAATYAPARRLLESQTPIERAIVLLPLIEYATARVHDQSPAAFARAGADVLRWTAAILVGADAPSAAPIPQVITTALGAPRGYDDIIRRLLILAADHALDSTTYAVRALANVGITPYRATAAGLMASQGQRLQHLRLTDIARLLEEILTAPDPRGPIEARQRAGESLASFDGSVYPDGDPRGAALFAAIEAKFGDDADVRRLRHAADAVVALGGRGPNFMMTALFVGRKAGLAGHEIAIAAIGRTAGWIAHAMEQYYGREMVRPRTTYTGPLPE
jgi:citrate synthase